MLQKSHSSREIRSKKTSLPLWGRRSCRKHRSIQSSSAHQLQWSERPAIPLGCHWLEYMRHSEEGSNNKYMDKIKGIAILGCDGAENCRRPPPDDLHAGDADCATGKSRRPRRQQFKLRTGGTKLRRRHWSEEHRERERERRRGLKRARAEKWWGWAGKKGGSQKITDGYTASVEDTWTEATNGLLGLGVDYSFVFEGWAPFCNFVSSNDVDFWNIL